jgi:hypothetical protein
MAWIKGTATFRWYYCELRIIVYLQYVGTDVSTERFVCVHSKYGDAPSRFVFLLKD